MHKAESQKTPAEGQKADGLSYDAYRAARERFFASLRADSQARRVESRSPGTFASTSRSACSGPADAKDSPSGTHFDP